METGYSSQLMLTYSCFILVKLDSFIQNMLKHSTIYKPSNAFHCSIYYWFSVIPWLPGELIIFWVSECLKQKELIKKSFIRVYKGNQSKHRIKGKYYRKIGQIDKNRKYRIMGCFKNVKVSYKGVGFIETVVLFLYLVY